MYIHSNVFRSHNNTFLDRYYWILELFLQNILFPGWGGNLLLLLAIKINPLKKMGFDWMCIQKRDTLCLPPIFIWGTVNRHQTIYHCAGPRAKLFLRYYCFWTLDCIKSIANYIQFENSFGYTYLPLFTFSVRQIL